jgi:uncharacterized protein
MEFEWDPEKAETNFRKHGISFGQACKAFSDPRAIEVFDDSGLPDEDRANLIGMVDGMIVYTDRPPRIRLISARKATRNENNIYYHENSL